MTTFDERLKSCPICGGKCYIEIYGVSAIISVKVGCGNCGLSNHRSFINQATNTTEKVIEYWNNRKGE